MWMKKQMPLRKGQKYIFCERHGLSRGTTTLTISGTIPIAAPFTMVEQTSKFDSLGGGNIGTGFYVAFCFFFSFWDCFKEGHIQLSNQGSGWKGSKTYLKTHEYCKIHRKPSSFSLLNYLFEKNIFHRSIQLLERVYQAFFPIKNCFIFEKCKDPHQFGYTIMISSLIVFVFNHAFYQPLP